jgi:trigger factor
MNITQSTKGDNLISIKISVVKEDYQEALEKSLKQLRHRANVPGFRPGMVPMGMIKKMYGASAKMEALNTVVSENLNKHIFDNKLDLLGYPLSDIELQQPADLEKEDDMDFYFEAALRPEINIDFTNTMVDFYHIVPTDEEVDKVIEDLLQRNPNTSHPETVGEDDRLEIKVREAKDGKEVEGGFEKDGVYFNMSQIKNKTQRKKFIDKEVGAEFIVNFAKVFGSEEEAAKVLGSDAPAGSDFNIIIDDAIRNEKPELDEEFFKKIFPNQEIKDLDAFKKAVKAEMEKQHEAETDPILFNKMIDEMVAAVKFDLPDAFMKRWIVDNSQGKITPEDIEKNYDNDYVKGLRWQLIEDAIVKANPELIIKDEEVKDFVLKQIFPGIDYATLEDDMKANLDKIAANYLKDQQQVSGLKNQLADVKMTAFLKGKMNINYEETTSADFMKKLEKERKAKKK